MTTESHELALCLINENTPRFAYDRRVNLARHETRNGRANAGTWADILSSYARHYERQHGGPDFGKIFTTTDVLLAAIEVSEYYREHVKEIDAA